MPLRLHAAPAAAAALALAAASLAAAAASLAPPAAAAVPAAVATAATARARPAAAAEAAAVAAAVLRGLVRRDGRLDGLLAAERAGRVVLAAVRQRGRHRPHQVERGLGLPTGVSNPTRYSWACGRGGGVVGCGSNPTRQLGPRAIRH